MISMIACSSQNGVIGQDNDMPWHLPEDLKFFKKTTLGHTVVMGRKTFESIGKPLPQRRNIIITRSKDFLPEGCEVMHSVEEVLQVEGDIFITGGAQLYEQFLPHADRIYLTVIHEDIEGDTFFPSLDQSWEVIEERKGQRDEKNPYEYTFYTYERK
ncbi:dihydrofolate reductase [Bacillus horti]|uniref:Dihydrofolate reductase n=1 Tax=Caldalkalibacillus horti TaxID=77523 RepID=A0ABT9VTV8_9BACI|nr:dihydrofolate reductase [Bacillus horti]MDQ0164421.1 dihydrofolate reductase [Bacillus horti]